MPHSMKSHIPRRKDDNISAGEHVKSMMFHVHHDLVLADTALSEVLASGLRSEVYSLSFQT